MKTKNKWLTAAAAAVIACTFFFACKKDTPATTSPITPPSTTSKSQVSVYMMDDPVSYYKVLLDIQKVAVKIDTSAKHEDADDNHQWDEDYKGHNGKGTFWDTLKITPGVYDLLKLRNGTDTLLATGSVHKGKILQVKVTLGNNNTIYIDSATHFPLNIAGSHDFFVNVKKEDIAATNSNQYKIWFDFNLARSISYANNKYWLNPRLKPFNDDTKSKLEGNVMPKDAAGFVSVYNKADTLYAIPRNDGYFKLRGVQAGTYSILFKGAHGYKDSTVANVNVTGNGVTKVPTVTLYK